MTKARTITVNYTWGKRETGIAIWPNRGRVLRHIADMAPGQLKEAIDLAQSVLIELDEFSMAMPEPNMRPDMLNRPKGWWVSVHFGGPDIDYEVRTFAAWLLTQQHPENPVAIAIYGPEWVISSLPDCSKDHKHSTRLLSDGKAVCVAVHVTGRALRKMEREGAFA